MTIDEKIIEVSDVAESFGYNTSVINVDTVLKLIHEALKKQREICTEIYVKEENDRDGGFSPAIERDIQNAPEPEL